MQTGGSVRRSANAKVPSERAMLLAEGREQRDGGARSGAKTSHQPRTTFTKMAEERGLRKTVGATSHKSLRGPGASPAARLQLFWNFVQVVI